MEIMCTVLAVTRLVQSATLLASEITYGTIEACHQMLIQTRPHWPTCLARYGFG